MYSKWGGLPANASMPVGWKTWLRQAGDFLLGLPFLRARYRDRTSTIQQPVAMADSTKRKRTEDEKALPHVKKAKVTGPAPSSIKVTSVLKSQIPPVIGMVDLMSMSITQPY